MTFHVRQIFGIALVGLLFGCATSHQPTSSFVNENATKVESVAVFAITTDAGIRNDFENAFSTVFSSEGIPTVSTVNYLPDLGSLKDDQSIIDMYDLTDTNVGLTIEVTKERSAAAQTTTNAMSAVWIAGLLLDEPNLRRAGAWGGVAAYSQAGKYQLRLSLWDAKTAELQWSMDTNSFTNDNTAKDAKTLAEAVLKELRRQGLVQ